jgi:hypothetical protein
MTTHRPPYTLAVRLSTAAALALLTGIVAPAPLASQAATDGLTGSRVRVTAPNFADHRVVGVVSRYTDTRLEVTEEATDSVYVFPLRAISRLDPYKGGSAGSTAGYRASFGAFLGGALGLLGGAVLASVGDGERNAAVTVVLGGAAGAGGGAALGALTGAAFPSERWGWVMSPWGYDPALRPGDR